MSVNEIEKENLAASRSMPFSWCFYCCREVDLEIEKDHFNEDSECLGKVEDEKNQIVMELEK